MKNDLFNQQVTKKLDTLAHEHRNKAVVMEKVLTEIVNKPRSYLGLWKMTGFAVTAAIMGVMVVPNVMQLNSKPYTQQAITTPKLSPQMVEDLEMLSVFAEDKTSHGS